MIPYMDGEVYRMKQKKYKWSKLDSILVKIPIKIGKWSILNWKHQLQCKIRGHMNIVLKAQSPKNEFMYCVACSCCGQVFLKQKYDRPKLTEVKS